MKLRSKLLIAASLLAVPCAGAAKPHPAPPAAAKPAAQVNLLQGLEFYQVDAPHSEVGFVVPWMGVSHVRGSFQEFSGTLAFDPQDVTRSSITIVIKAASINTGFAMRDKDLRGAEFFDVEHHPSIVFRSTAVEKTADGFVLHGTLDIRGNVHEVAIPFTYNGRIQDVSGDWRVGFEGHLTVERKAFGIVGPPRFNAMTTLNKLVIGEQVDVPLALEGWRQSPKDTLPSHVADSLYREVVAHGVPAVAKQWRAARVGTPDSLLRVDEGAINGVGWQLLAHQRDTDALALFGLEIEAWPQSAFGQVGLAQTYATQGRREPALAACDRALALNPGATRASEIRRRLTSS